ncbi:MAG: YlbF family regulator, partial [Gemmatimonadales bacterium]
SLEGKSDLEPALKRLKELSEQIEAGAAEGREPSDDQKQEYGRLVDEIQQDSNYQQMVAAQSNFDKLMYRVNEQIMEGIREGASSRIITLE